MLLECTSNKYIFTHSPASDQKGNSSSSQPPAKRSKLVSLIWILYILHGECGTPGVCDPQVVQ